jgi:hypothetical protein
MRVIFLILATAAVAGCTVKETVVRQEPAPPPAATVYQAPPPVVQTPTEGRPATIIYTVMGQQQFNQAAVQAANWCRANYGTDARLVDQSRSTAGDRVTFACVTG